MAGFVGVHCPLGELERRELARGDRLVGDARRDFETCHMHTTYDLEVDSREAPDANAERIIGAWTSRSRPSAFDRMIVS